MASGDTFSPEEEAMLQERLDKRRAEALEKSRANGWRYQPLRMNNRQRYPEDDSPLASRDFSLEITLNEGHKDLFKSDDDILRFLKSNGFQIQKINAVYSSGKGVFILTAQDQLCKNNLESFLRAKLGKKCEISFHVGNLYEKPQTKTVHVYNVPLEMPEWFITQTFEKYGEILRISYGRHYLHNHIYNGAVHIRFESVEKHIPFYIDLGCTRVKVKYNGQNDDMFCTYCQQRGHYRSKCVNQPRCETCFEVGHTKETFLCYKNKDFTQENYESTENPLTGSTEPQEKEKENIQADPDPERIEDVPAEPRVDENQPEGAEQGAPRSPEPEQPEHTNTIQDGTEKPRPEGAGAENHQSVEDPPEMDVSEADKQTPTESTKPTKTSVVSGISPIAPNGQEGRNSARQGTPVTTPEPGKSPAVGGALNGQELSPTYAEIAKSPPKITRKKIPVKINTKVKALSPQEKLPRREESHSPNGLIIDEGSNGELDGSDIPTTPKTSSPLLSKRGSPLFSVNDKRSIFYDIGNIGNTVLPKDQPTSNSFNLIAEAREKILNKAKQRRSTSGIRHQPYSNSSPARTDQKKST